MSYQSEILFGCTHISQEKMLKIWGKSNYYFAAKSRMSGGFKGAGFTPLQSARGQKWALYLLILCRPWLSQRPAVFFCVSVCVSGCCTQNFTVLRQKLSVWEYFYWTAPNFFRRAWSENGWARKKVNNFVYRCHRNKIRKPAKRPWSLLSESVLVFFVKTRETLKRILLRCSLSTADTVIAFGCGPL